MIAMAMCYTVLIMMFLPLYQKVWTVLKLLFSVRKVTAYCLKTMGVVMVTGREKAWLEGIIFRLST